MPRFHHPVLAAFGRDRQAVKLAREADCEVAYVDHLLNFAEAFGNNLSGLDGDELSERGFVGAKLFAEQPDEFATLRRRHVAPLEKRSMGRFDLAAHIRGANNFNASDGLPGDRGGHFKCSV